MYPRDSLHYKSFGSFGLVHRVIANDIPRYEIAKVPVCDLRCVALKTRGPRAGLPCGNIATGHPLVDHDPQTGVQRWIGYCRNHNHQLLDEWRQQRFTQWQENGYPSPPANTGGVLAKHFPTGSWNRHYWWAAGPRPLPDDEPEPEETQKPLQLTVIAGEAQADAFDGERSRRGHLTVCDETGPSS